MLEKHRLASEALQAFKAWFSESRVEAYASCEELHSRAAEEPRVNLILQLDAEGIDEKDISELLATRLHPEGLFLRLCGCDGHDAPDCDEDGSSSHRLFRRLLTARCEGAAWHKGKEVSFEPPPSDESLRQRRARLAISTPRERAAACRLQLLRVVAEGVDRGIVAVRDAPSSDAKILGLKHRGDYAVIEGEELPWVRLSVEDEWYAEFLELRRLEGEAAPLSAWMLRDGSALGFGVLLAPD